MTLSAWLAVALLYGLAIGSFLNVVIWRLPRGGSIAEPTWSFCPRCEHRLGAFDLFPVFSFLLLRARCRYCHEPISWRYPGVELLTGLLFGGVAAHAFLTGQFWYDAVFDCAFTAILICVFFIDLEHFVIPDGLSVLGVLIGFAHAGVAAFYGRAGALLESLYGFLGFSGLIIFIGLVSYVVLVALADKRMSVGRAAWEYLRGTVWDWAYVACWSVGVVLPPVRRWVDKTFGAPEPLEGFTQAEIEQDEDAGGMGGGDGKLAAAIGANLGLGLALGSFVFAIFLGAVPGLILMLRQRRRLGQRTPIPFGPAMAAGALLALCFGHPLAVWYVARYWSFPGSPFAPAPPGGGVSGP